MVSSVKHILLPTDFSDCTKNALKFATKIAGKNGASVTLLHTIEPPYNFSAVIEDMLDRLKKTANSQLDKLIQEFTSQHPGSRTQFTLWIHESLLHTNFTKKLGIYSKLPLMVLSRE